MLIGLILWNRLPDRIPTHWNFSGEIDGYGGKASVVFGIPVFILAMHLFSISATRQDPQSGNITQKIRSLVLWICPVVSLFLCILIYPSAMGYEVDSVLWADVLIGGMFIVFGNYLPKCRPNNTIGIKLPWLLADDDLWKRTHRMAGPLWMIGGFVILLDAFLQSKRMWVIMTAFVVLTAVPVIYSLALCQKKKHM